MLVVGFLVGALIISLGGESGAIYAGILTAFSNIPSAVAVFISLATIIPTTASRAFSHWRAGNVNLRFGWIILLGEVADSLSSGLLPQSLYTRLTGIILLLALQMLGHLNGSLCSPA